MFNNYKMLNDINFLNEYKGRKRTELLKNGIMNSVRYYRSVGYFRSSVYALFNREFRSFFEKGGLAKIICGYEISDEDWQTMVAGSSKYGFKGMPMKFFKDTWNPKINKIYGMKQAADNFNRTKTMLGWKW